MLNKNNIRKLVVEEINKYFGTQVVTEGIFEADDADDADEDKPKRKKPLSDKEKEWEKRIEKAHEKNGDEATSNNSEFVRDFLGSEYINTEKVILKARPDMTDQGAASYGSKIVKGKRPVTVNLVDTVSDVMGDIAR